MPRPRQRHARGPLRHARAPVQRHLRWCVSGRRRSRKHGEFRGIFAGSTGESIKSDIWPRLSDGSPQLRTRCKRRPSRRAAPMNILILGSGGREHALAWAVMQNPKCDKLIVAPGNAGIAQIADCAKHRCRGRRHGGLQLRAEENAIDFVIVGPEAPLAAGVADRLREAGCAGLRPLGRAAAKLEASKSLHQGNLRRGRGPHRRDTGTSPTPRPPRPISASNGAPIVVKADGLAAGKGVIVAMDEATALDAIDDMFGGAFGGAGAEVVIEEFMEGEEASFFILWLTARPPCPSAPRRTTSASAKATPDLNTGGMGAYSPATGADRRPSRKRQWKKSSSPRLTRWPIAARPIRACSMPA